MISIFTEVLELNHKLAMTWIYFIPAVIYQGRSSLAVYFYISVGHGKQTVMVVLVISESYMVVKAYRE